MANKPVHEVRLGSIKAAIWANDTTMGTRYNVTLARLYKDVDQWKSSDSFGRDDLPLVGKVADLAHTWIFDHGQNGNGNGNGHHADAPADAKTGGQANPGGQPRGDNPRKSKRQEVAEND